MLCVNIVDHSACSPGVYIIRHCEAKILYGTGASGSA